MTFVAFYQWFETTVPCVYGGFVAGAALAAVLSAKAAGHEANDAFHRGFAAGREYEEYARGNAR